ncbi:beta-glucosidase [Cohnella sp. OV330]|uniref:glycoside hydrolase family 3 N-terminal domain-containing protein n=1 Tax=Cohnella sp. OV330 TaxID=1855288 RepID=UPI0008F0F701|nr:glycoside hydrolase family 3 N-terminal domain-containing protein [Cohnella sp. OV330]SFB58870.1 beta-glucosidase [Cohnella sp. OV330]
MLGLWHAFIETPRLKLKLQFKVAKKAVYALDMAMEPFPLPVRFDRVEAEGGTLRATGSAYWKPDEEASVELRFAEDAFEGSLRLPSFGAFALAGIRGRGPSLYASLADEIAACRKADVPARGDAEIREAVETLLGKLSLADKVSQMCQCMASNFSFGGAVASDPPEKLVAEGRAGSVLGAFDLGRVFELQRIAVERSPHGIPLLFNNDIIHGAQTIFPVPLAWACSWDMDAIREACAVAGREAAASGIVYNHGPMVDISRDPRWGRVVEGAGEDPYLGALIAKAQVEGFQGGTGGQGSLRDPDTIVACLKHFVGYGAAEGGRDYNTVDMSEATLRNVYLPPFQAGIESGAGSVMNAFNIYQGVPVAASVPLLKELLRDELGFEGVLISDYGAVDEIVQHGHARNAKEAAKKAVDATMDIEMVTRAYDHLPQLIAEGKLSEAQLDDAVRRILTLKYRLGLMDDPYRYIRPEREAELHFSEPHLAASRALAAKSIVLLKNDGALPLGGASGASGRLEGAGDAASLPSAASRDCGPGGRGKLALIGPFADSKDLLGPWQFSRYVHETVTLYEGLVAAGYSEDRLLYAQGSGVGAPIDGGIEAAVDRAVQADIVLLALGEDSGMSGEAASRMRIALPDAQLRLAEAVAATGKPVVLVLTNGRPLDLTWFDAHMNAIVETWFLGSQAGRAIADVLTGACNPSGRLTMSFPLHEGQVPVYYNHFRTGRPLTEANAGEKFISKYLDGPNEPLYPFGYGLSYARFEYGELCLGADTLKPGGKLEARVTVTNALGPAGVETVQLYIQDVCGSIVRPVKELKGFAQVALAPGESREIVFAIGESDLVFWSPAAGYAAEPGEFRVMVGPNSRDVRTASFELEEP